MHHGIIRFGAICGRHPVTDDQPIRACTDNNPRAILDLTGQDHLCQRVLQAALDDPLQGPRPKDRIISFGGQPILGRIIQINGDFTRSEAFRQKPKLDFNNPTHIGAAQTIKHNHIV